ncbi:tRNA wybutosine-synthesizing protein 5-like [Lytechinus variegatus]|uniref:tRNA wybutosine-synthesizing protein 5-like n=1 Tax=Lytechinus variegatus TaxID=7654 RepID=UPI001BB14F12|nr:tRNA wybutosine-synthesizing protein 5-like [Lytechinus variegatus]
MESEGKWIKKDVPVYTDVSNTKFLDVIYQKRNPAVIRGLDIGPCVEKWTAEYLASQGGDTEVKIHVSPSSKMDFINKNYAYRSLPFSELIHRCAKEVQEDFFFEKNELYYLRSLGEDPRKGIADVKAQFPSLAGDLEIPEFFNQEQFFSSVFRVGSANLQLWTHYDVMDNILIQVRGHKRVILFSPEDANHLYLTGDKSAVMDLDNPDFDNYPSLKLATPYHCLLEPGDVLFIPALWFHNVVSLDFSVAVNVFWRHLDISCYDNKDTYGNKDPVAASKALQIVQRAIKSLEGLPDEYRDFYGRRLVREIEKKTYAVEDKR